MDADGQHRPEDMISIFEKFKTEEQDLIVGSRWLEHNPEQKSSASRRMGMLFFSWLTQKLTGQAFSDTINGMKMMNPAVAKELLTGKFGIFTRSSHLSTRQKLSYW